MKTYYIGHDKAYKKCKAEGMPGWDTQEEFYESITLLKQLFQAKYVPQNGKLLELGCGAGNVTLWLAEQGYEVYGVDIASTAVEWAQENAKKRKLQADFQVGNVLDLKAYPDEFFDIVLDGHCFHCIIGEDRKRFLSSARRVLKSQGFLQVRTMCGDATNEDMKTHFDPQSRCLIYGDVASRYLGLPEDILDEITHAGFHILHWEVKPRKDKNDQDELLVAATRP